MSSEKMRWLLLPSGMIEGPFPIEKVTRALAAGKIPHGSRIAESDQGPWEPIEHRHEQPVVAPPSLNWHVAMRGERQGPFSESRVVSMAESGELAPTDLVWSTGMVAWIPAADVPTIAGAFVPRYGSPPPLPLAEHPVVPALPTGRAAASFIATPTDATARAPSSSRGASDEIWALVALVVPVISISGQWLWISNLRVIDVLRSNPQQTLLMIQALTLILCGILVGLDAAKLGIGGPDDLNSNGRRRANGPAHWGIFVALLFLVGYPSYMAIRSRRGVRNLIIGAIAVMSGFIIGSLYLFAKLETGLRQTGFGG